MNFFKPSMRYLGLVAAFMMTGPSFNAHARGNFPSILPGGFANACSTCHPGGRTNRLNLNSFGRTIQDSFGGSRARFTWTDVCDIDSDGDGASNGLELGDPDCDGQRDPSLEITQPGDVTSTPSLPLGGMPAGGEMVPPMGGEPNLCDDWYYQVCQGDDDCERPGYICGAVQDDCVASRCGCDENTGMAGACTRDCLLGARLCERGERPPAGGEVAPPMAGEVMSPMGGEPNLCDDWYYQVCQGDDDCERPGYICGEVRRGCVASRCDCDENTGMAGVCTRDCRQGVGLCERGERPPAGGEMGPSMAGEVMPPIGGEPNLCDDWYYRVCRDDTDCERPGYICGAVRRGCVSGNCGCDPATGNAGFCTQDCRQGVGLCERGERPPLGGDAVASMGGGAMASAGQDGMMPMGGDTIGSEAGEPMSSMGGDLAQPIGGIGGSLCDDWYYQTCVEDADCEREGYVCGAIQANCVASRCDCDENTGMPGVCTRDCLMGVGLCEARSDSGAPSMALGGAIGGMSVEGGGRDNQGNSVPGGMPLTAGSAAGVDAMVDGSAGISITQAGMMTENGTVETSGGGPSTPNQQGGIGTNSETDTSSDSGGFCAAHGAGSNSGQATHVIFAALVFGLLALRRRFIG
ncbi:MAG: hypothetical protein VX589_02925 [Myxococcota bacterium]|nr:hypothetical protein [Myxococcota bacterium]